MFDRIVSQSILISCKVFKLKSMPKCWDKKFRIGLAETLRYLSIVQSNRYLQQHQPLPDDCAKHETQSRITLILF